MRATNPENDWKRQQFCLNISMIKLATTSGMLSELLGEDHPAALWFFASTQEAMMLNGIDDEAVAKGTDESIIKFSIPGVILFYLSEAIREVEKDPASSPMLRESVFAVSKWWVPAFKQLLRFLAGETDKGFSRFDEFGNSMN